MAGIKLAVEPAPVPTGTSPPPKIEGSTKPARSGRDQARDIAGSGMEHYRESQAAVNGRVAKRNQRAAALVGIEKNNSPRRS